MDEIGRQMLSRLQAALPQAIVQWEKEPGPAGLKGGVLTAEWQLRKFTLQFDSRSEGGGGEGPDDSLVEQVVDDFLDFFARSIYPREKFTRMV